MIQFCLALQRPLRTSIIPKILNFDDIKTESGWGEVPKNHSFLDFSGLLAFKPSDPALEGLISDEDLNCATSSPNALYGTRYNFESHSGGEPIKLPNIALNQDSNLSAENPVSFELRALKIKPLNMPFAYTCLSIRGHTSSNETFDWEVDFPAGFHDVLNVKLETFCGYPWTHLTKVELWADFHNDGVILDWEYCLDDLDIKLEFR